MTAELVNLRRARKAKARVAAAGAAAENRNRVGRSKTERALTAAREAQVTREQDRKKLDD